MIIDAKKYSVLLNVITFVFMTSYSNASILNSPKYNNNSSFNKSHFSNKYTFNENYSFVNNDISKEKNIKNSETIIKSNDTVQDYIHTQNKTMFDIVKIDVNEVQDEFGDLFSYNIYVTQTSSLDDDLLFEKSLELTDSINNKFSTDTKSYSITYIFV
jgi:hypothetical protein